MTISSPPKITATMSVHAEEASIVVGDERVMVVAGNLSISFTPDAAIRLANQLTDAVDEIDGRGTGNEIRGQS